MLNSRERRALKTIEKKYNRMRHAARRYDKDADFVAFLGDNPQNVLELQQRQSSDSAQKQGFHVELHPPKMADAEGEVGDPVFSSA